MRIKSSKLVLERAWFPHYVSEPCAWVRSPLNPFHPHSCEEPFESYGNRADVARSVWVITADSGAVCELGCLQRAWWGGQGTRGPGGERNRELASDCSLPGQCCGELLAKFGEFRLHGASGRALVSSSIELGQRGLLGGPLVLLCLWETIPPTFATAVPHSEKAQCFRELKICVQAFCRVLSHHCCSAPRGEGRTLWSPSPRSAVLGWGAQAFVFKASLYQLLVMVLGKLLTCLSCNKSTS